MAEVQEARSLRWVSNMLGGPDQEHGFPRTASFYCECAAAKLEAQQKRIEELELKVDCQAEQIENLSEQVGDPE